MYRIFTDDAMAKIHASKNPSTGVVVLDHDHFGCPGCDRVLGLEDLVILLAEPRHTLYKRSSAGSPSFPRRLRDRRSIAVRCRDAKSYLEEQAK